MCHDNISEQHQKIVVLGHQVRRECFDDLSRKDTEINSHVSDLNGEDLMNLISERKDPKK